MKAPDVIYVEFSEDVNLAFEKQPFEETPTYIRKDALLEWAKEHQEGERQGSYTWSCYQVFIDKLNSM